jgi:SAM-dependent methyltransferase
MGIGAKVRGLCGPLEPFVTELYRRIFFDPNRFIKSVSQQGTPARVLEVGCGEGAITSRLLNLWPEVRIDAIDLTPRLGRLLEGDRSRVRLQQIPVEQFAAEEPCSVDLVMICDVMHHIPWDLHPSIFAASLKALKPGGTLIIKEWIHNLHPIYWLGYFCDRVISGERIRYGSRDEWAEKFRIAFGADAIKTEFSISPWSCNHAFVMKPSDSK